MDDGSMTICREETAVSVSGGGGAGSGTATLVPPEDAEHLTVMDELAAVGYAADTDVAQLFEKSGELLHVLA